MSFVYALFNWLYTFELFIWTADQPVWVQVVIGIFAFIIIAAVLVLTIIALLASIMFMIFALFVRD